MRLRLLGPVELWSQPGRIELGTPQQRCVLAALAITPRQTLPVETLVERVWGERSPRQVRKVLYTYVSRLRSLLREAAGGEESVALPRRTGGYALDVAPELIDLHAARQLTYQARAAAGQGGAGDRQAAELLAQACQLWTGPPLAGVAGDWAERVRTGLEYERLGLLRERFEAALRIGEHEQMIGPLSEAVAANPLTESLAGLLMLALHRADRAAEALAVYGRLRQRMIDDLGHEPGPGLCRLHEQVLRRDPELDLRTPLAELATGTAGALPAPAAGADLAAPARAAATPRQLEAAWLPMCQLPPDLRHFVGREGLVKELSSALQPDPGPVAVPVVTVCGQPGVGKTALATRIAHLVREHFPDGQWFVPLAAGDRVPGPEQILGELLESAGLAPAAVPSGLTRRAAALRARLADRRVLLVLDGAADASQVRPLLPGTGSSAVLVTSRRRLTGLTEAEDVRLDPLGATEALDLLALLIGSPRVAAEPAAASEICAACGRLPLALRIAAARLAAVPEWPLRRFADRLRERYRRLDELAAGDLAVRPALAYSHRSLHPPARAAFGRLARLGTSPFTASGAAALARVSDGERLVEELLNAGLLEPVAAATATEPRYRLPELVAAYAAELTAG